MSEAAGGPHARAYLGLGSNLADRLSNLQRAVDLLESRPGIDAVRSSRVYETEPVGPPQPDYLNAVIEVLTSLAPLDLLDACMSVERDMGRVRGERWGARIIDIDLLTYEREAINHPRLLIPHPRMHQRAFVMAPLLELDDNPPLPGGRTVGDLRIDGAGSAVRLFTEPLLIASAGPGPAAILAADR